MQLLELPPAWVNDYIGKPFEDLGRGPDVFDCWGLYKHALETKLGLFGLPDHVGEYSKAAGRVVSALLDAERRKWLQVSVLQLGDAVMMCSRGRPQHVGLVVAENLMLHIERGTAACLEELDSPRLKGRIDGYYRHPAA